MLLAYRRFALAMAATLLAACSRQPAAPEPVRAVRAVTVAAEPAGLQLEFAADVRARTESRLSFRIGGKLVRRLVGLGDAVKPGQLLAQLDPQDLQLSQNAARAALAAAEANHAQALADFQRFKELRDQGFISTAELERRDTALTAARSQMDQARAQAGVTRNQADYARLVADAAGVVTGVEAEPGMVLASGTPVLRVAHDGPRDAVFAVPEDKVELLRAAAAQPGALKVRGWGNGGHAVPASVREIAAATDPVTRTFLVKADIGDAALKLGQTATVLLELPTAQAAIKLPLAAVMQWQGGSAVWLLDAATMTVQPQPVKVAGADANQVLIREGLTPGQTVVTAGVHVLNPGQKVKRYLEPDSAELARQ